jgi:hypothetical protein
MTPQINDNIKVKTGRFYCVCGEFDEEKQAYPCNKLNGDFQKASETIYFVKKESIREIVQPPVEEVEESETDSDSEVDETPES